VVSPSRRQCWRPTKTHRLKSVPPKTKAGVTRPTETETAGQALAAVDWEKDLTAADSSLEMSKTV
jgi:hypothetical protein